MRAFAAAVLGCLLVLMATARPAWAQATIGEPLEQGDIPGAKHPDDEEKAAGERDAGPPDAGTVAAHDSGAQAFGLIAQPPKATEGSIVKAWQQRVERLEAGDLKRVETEERNLESIRQELGIENLFSPATALIREADDLIRAGHGEEALQRCETAATLAPDFDLAHYCVARATFAKSFIAIGPALSAVTRGYNATIADVRARRHWTTNISLACFAGIALGGALLVFLLLVRAGRLGLHDFHHLFPTAVPFWQTALILLVLIGLPPLLGLGLLGSLAVSALALAAVVQRGEAIALCVAFVLAAGAQYGTGLAVRASSFGRVAQDVYLLERGDAPEAAADRLRARSDQGMKNYATAYALGHYHKRLGHYSEALAAYQSALQLQSTAQILNNIGNIYSLEGNAEEAKKSYLAASKANSRLAAPLWNIARLYFKETKVEDGEQALQRARALDPANASRLADQGSSTDEARANQILVDIPLPNEAIEKLAEIESREMSAGSATWPLLTGHLTETQVMVVCLVLALLIGLIHSQQRKLKPSSRCERCGRAVCVRCDPELTQTSGMCGQCISVFVRKTGVDPADRIRKEVEVRSYNRRRGILSRVFAVLIGGGGHVLTGHIIIGGLVLLVFSQLLAQLLFWNGIVQLPVPITPSMGAVSVALVGVVFVIMDALSLWHLSRVEEGP